MSMNELIVSSSPHSKDHRTVRAIMGYVLVALSPAAAASVIYFKWRALLLIAISILSCLFFEFAYNLVLKRKQTLGDFSAIVTGVLLAFNLPVSAPLWIPPIGAFVAIVLIKMLFGGLGKNLLNPAMAGRVVLFLIFSNFLRGNWVTPFDGDVSATPLEYLLNASGELVKIGDKFSIFDCMLGNVAGCLGETSAVLLLLGGLFLIYKRVITWHIPVSFIGTVALITFLFPRFDDIAPFQFMQYHLFSGGLFLAAFFMATDYSTSPITPLGRIIYGFGCGLITVLIRYFSGYPEGVSVAVLVMNCLAVYLDTKTIPRHFGDTRNVFTVIADYAKGILGGRSLRKMRAAKNEEAAAGENVNVDADKKGSMVAHIRCKGSNVFANKKYTYYGMNDCVAADRLLGGYMTCQYGCLGFGNCVQECSQNAISIKDGVAVVNRALCNGCGVCLNACPKGVIEMLPRDSKILVNCASHDKGIRTREACNIGCIGCKHCENNCPEGAIRVVGNVAKIDYEKCVGCGVCAEKCPRKIINILVIRNEK